MSEARYLAELAYQLRLRRLPESEVAAAIETARSAALPSGQPFGEVLGTPLEYAETLPEGTAWSAGFKIAAVMVISAALVAGARAAWSLVLRMPPDAWVSTAIYLCAALWALAGVAIGYRTDHQVPAKR